MDNHTKVWLGGLAGFLLLSILAAFVIGGKENVELLTLHTDGEVTAGIDNPGSSDIGEPGDVIIEDVTDDGTFIASTVGVVAPMATSTAIPPTPFATATPIPTLTADPTTGATETATAVAATATATPTQDAQATETVSGIATPTPLGTTPLPEPTPSGPGQFRVESFEDEGATVSINTMSVTINEDGTGTVVGALAVSWPDGRSVGLKVDDDFTYDTQYEDVRVGVNAQYDFKAVSDEDDISEDGGTMRIPNPLLRVGSICSKVCLTFDY